MILRKSIFLSIILPVLFVFGTTTQAAGQQTVENNKTGHLRITEKKSCCTKASSKKMTVSVNMSKKDKPEQNLENCPLQGTTDCPLLRNCPKKGKPDCPIVQNCPKKETPDCPYKKGVASCCAEI